LRLAPAESDPLVVARDICEAYAKAFPMTLKWPDRRPIVWMFPAGGEKNPDPIEWVGNAPKMRQPGPVDEEFRRLTMAKTGAIIAAAKAVDAQGVIIWEIEGTAIPAITYVGDPRLTCWLNPKMDAVADEMFRKMGDAGLRYGVCLRPSRVVYNKARNALQHTYENAEDPFAELDAKLEYARKRWGCTLFYVDTCGVNRPRGGGRRPVWGLISPEDWRRLSEKHADVLVIPEFGSPATYPYIAPYSELRMGSLGSPDLVHACWPEAFGVLSRQDDDAVERHEVFVRATLNGDVILGHAGDARTQAGINHSRAEAALLKAGAPDLPAGAAELTALLTSPDAKVRYSAARKLGEAKAASAVEALMKMLGDQDWLARKSAVVALGEIGDARAVGPLEALLKDHAAYMDWVAARALAKIGKPSVGVLLGTIRDKEAQTAAAAVWALGAIGDPSAAASLAELVKDPQGDYQVRRRAIDSLGRIGGDATVEALVTALQSRGLRTLAAQQLGKLSDPRATRALQEAMDKERTVAEQDRDFLRALSNALRNRPR
ncbi:MAG TPA: HEAT repeat domain-containing protein, partial [Phycisphaerae bacterium]|nr:HEAT repeat domain-containing protein [Phycisphaerae bacterium]